MSCETEVGSILHRDGSEVSYDGLPVTEFKVIFSKLPQTVFFLQKISIPDVSITPITQYTSQLDIDQIGEKMQFQPITLTFLIDSKLRNYREIFDWMKRITVNQSQKDEESDLILIINRLQKIRFVDCWPTQLSGMEFSVVDTDTQYLTATVTLHSDWFEFMS